MIATFLPEEEVIGLKEIFMAMDENGDGMLTLAELHHALKAKGATLPAELAKQIMEASDLNADGVIDYYEFLGATVCNKASSIHICNGAKFKCDVNMLV